MDYQVSTFEQRTAGIDYSAARRKNLTKYDVLIIASLVEREASSVKERRLVAGVIENRLRAGMRLDIDATVQYAVGSWKAEITKADLDIDSPYNTRKFPGLPPGPIASPGAASIAAALAPADVPYLFFVARADGGHEFRTTFAEHQQAIADIKRAKRQGTR